VTKKEIVKTISEEIGLTQLKTKEIVQKTFDAIVETLVDEGRIELRNFGVFEVKKRAARKARNPRTGQRVDVPEKFVVTFKPGKEMEERVRRLSQEREQREARAAAEQDSARPASAMGSGSIASSPGTVEDAESGPADPTSHRSAREEMGPTRDYRSSQGIGGSPIGQG
jgi:nucleoid DNA-binding protein